MEESRKSPEGNREGEALSSGPSLRIEKQVRKNKWSAGCLRKDKRGIRCSEQDRVKRL